MSKVSNKINTVFSWIFCIAMICLLTVSLFHITNIKEEPNYIFGYRLISLTSGSMEPTIKTNSLTLTKKVDSINDLKVGDIISFHIVVDDEEYKITHRIYDIDPNTGFIVTKGDNNNVTDSDLINISNVESKVCLIMNWTATFGKLWQNHVRGNELIFGLGMMFISLFIIVMVFWGDKKKE